MECVKSIGHGVFAVIKVILSNRNDLELIMNYIQTIVSVININKKTSMVTGIRTHNLHDIVKAIHPLCYE